MFSSCSEYATNVAPQQPFVTGFAVILGVARWEQQPKSVWQARRPAKVPRAALPAGNITSADVAKP